MKYITSFIVFFCIISAVCGTERNKEDINKALLSAVKDNNKKEVIKLLRKKADPNAANAFGQTAIGHAVIMDNTDIVKTLIEYGGEVNTSIVIPTLERGIKIQKEYPLLILAVQKKNIEMVTLLLAHGADINAGSYNGATGLILAVNLNHTDMVQLLLSNNADINAQMEDGKTALIWAILRKRAEMVKLFLTHGADAGILDERGKDALAYAQKVGDKGTIKSIKETPHSGNVKTRTQKTYDMNRENKTITGRNILLYNSAIVLLIIAGISFFYFKK